MSTLVKSKSSQGSEGITENLTLLTLTTVDNHHTTVR